jgi:hypothetical protein
MDICFDFGIELEEDVSSLFDATLLRAYVLDDAFTLYLMPVPSLLR